VLPFARVVVLVVVGGVIVVTVVSDDPCVFIALIVSSFSFDPDDEPKK